MQQIGVRRGFVYFRQDKGRLLVGGGKGVVKGCLVLFGNFHGVESHVHIVLGNEGAVASGSSQVGLEAVTVVDVAVVGNGQVFIRLQAFVYFGLGLLGQLHFVHEVPTVSPEFTPQEVFIEEVRVLCQFDGQIDVVQGLFVLV